jgi:hypothetical protein
MAEDTIRWLDLSKHDVELLTLTFPDGVSRLVLRGETAPFEAGIIGPLGFSKTKAGWFACNNLIVSVPEFTKVFPQLVIADMPRAKVIRIARPATPAEPKRVDDELALREAKPLGVNYLGQEVFAGVVGRFVRAGSEGAIVREGDAASPAVFLRVADAQSLALCAKGLVDEMMRGRFMKIGDLEAFVRTIYDIPVLQRNDDKLARVNAAIELEMASRLVAESAGADRHTFGVAVRLHEAQPARDRAVRREGVPLPIVAAAARLLDAARPDAVGVLHAGSGVLAGILPAARVVNSEADTDFASPAARVAAPNAVWEKVPVGSVPSSVSFGPLRSVPGSSLQGVFTNRIDHLAAIQSLMIRTDKGRSVIVLGGDSADDGAAGSITHSRDLLNWVYQNYSVEGLVEIDSILTRKQPSAWPYRMLVVGDKLAKADMNALAPQYANTVSSFDELWEFTQSLTVAAPVAVPAPAAASVAPEAISPAIEAPPAVINPAAASKETEENAYQAPYVSFSKLGESEAMIPRNLVGPTNRALSRVAQANGDVDTYVATSLGLQSPKDLEKLFSPEQIDAVALSYHAMEQGKGIIIGDMTGVGKGRELSGVARWAFVHGKPVVVITEKANLFSDFWRDLTDTGTADMCMPFIVNADTSIIDGKGQRVFKSLSKEKQDAVIKSKDVLWNKDFNIAFATYSQFNKKPETSAKAAWLAKACEGAIVILDESHNAAGDSQVNANVEEALRKAHAVAYSSATYSDKPENMGVYLRVFPKGIGAAELRETLEVGGEPLMEILTAALAEDGAFIRREHDMSKLKFDPATDAGRQQRNEALADEMAEVLVLMSQAAKQAEYMMGLAEASDKNATYTLPNFGSRRYLANRQFMLALKVDLAVDEALAALQNGEKPVLTLESTMESLIREAVLDEEMSDEQLLSGDVVSDAALAANKATEVEIDAITFRDVLAKLFDKGISVNRRPETADGKKVKPESVHVLDLNIPEHAKKKMREIREQAMSVISRFDALPASPLDEFRQRLEEAGYSCGEISGRGVRLQKIGADKHRVVSAGAGNRFQIVREFNEGVLDVVMLTRSGSTGISLQNSPLFKDQRPRRMLEAQIFNNVKERLQVYGRCNRKGQISPPTISTLSTGLPGEVRNLAMQKKKLRALSANTTGNRESMADSDEVIDLINSVGEGVAISFLESRPAIASRLGIDLANAGDSESDSTTFTINALMSRVEMLRVSEQRQVIQELTEEYIARMAELEAIGRNPFKMTEHDWGARVLTREVFEPAMGTESVLDAAVYLSEIEYEKVARPIRSADLVRLQSASLSAMASDPRVGREANSASQWKSAVKACLTAARANVTALQKESVTAKLKSVEAALAETKSNAIKTLEKRYETLRDVLTNHLTLGSYVRFEHGGEKFAGVVAGMKMPAAGKEHLAGQYEFKILSPGQAEPTIYSLNTLVTCKVKVDRTLSRGVISQMFDTAHEGRVKVRRLTLDGNLFRSSQYAVRHELGSSVSYTDQSGARRRVILLNKDLDRETVMQLPLRLGDVTNARNWLKSDTKTPALFSRHDPADRLDETLLVERMKDGHFRIDVPKSGPAAALRKDKELLELVGKLTVRDERARATVPHAQLTAVLERLDKVGIRFYAPAEARTWLNRVRQLEPEAKSELKHAA